MCVHNDKPFINKIEQIILNSVLNVVWILQKSGWFVLLWPRDILLAWKPGNTNFSCFMICILNTDRLNQTLQE